MASFRAGGEYRQAHIVTHAEDEDEHERPEMCYESFNAQPKAPARVGEPATSESGYPAGQ